MRSSRMIQRVSFFKDCWSSLNHTPEINLLPSSNSFDCHDGVSFCHQVVGAGASFDDTALDYENVCAFKRSGTVGLGYTEDSTTLMGTNDTIVNGTAVSSYITADPSFLTVTLTNEGELL